MSVVGLDRRTWAPLLLVGVALGASLLSGFWLFVVTSTCVLAITLSSLVLLTGFAGQPSLAQATLAGYGAFIAIKLDGWGMPFPLTVLFAALLVAPIGAAIGVPALRIRGIHLALVTLGFALFSDRVLFTFEWFTGFPGGANVERPEWARTDYAMFLICFVGLLVVVVGLALLRRSRRGRQWFAIRDDEEGARAVGIKVQSEKLIAFSISAALAGLGGALFAYNVGAVSPVFSFNMTVSLNYTAIIALAGFPFVSAAIASAAWLILLPEIFRGTEVENANLLLVGLGLVIVVNRDPNGLASIIAVRVRRLRHRLGRSNVRGATDAQPERVLAAGPATAADPARPAERVRVRS